MDNWKNDLFTDVSELFILLYKIVLLSAFRSIWWCLPILGIWNKIIVNLTGFGHMGYWQAYFICLTFMAMMILFGGRR